MALSTRDLRCRACSLRPPHASFLSHACTCSVHSHVPVCSWLRVLAACRVANMVDELARVGIVEHAKPKMMMKRASTTSISVETAQKQHSRGSTIVRSASLDPDAYARLPLADCLI